MDELFWDALDLLEKPNRQQLARRAAVTGDLARQFFKGEEPGPSTWRLWYAGQLQGIAGLLRALLGRQLALETAAVLRGRKHPKAILEALSLDDLGLSALARRVDLDESQLGRELKILARHNLVETVKEGRERWARITVTGRTALAEVWGSVEVVAATSEWHRKSMPLQQHSEILPGQGKDDPEPSLDTFTFFKNRYPVSEMERFRDNAMMLVHG